MATQDEARQAILDAITSIAPTIHAGHTHAGEHIKSLAEAYALVKKNEKTSGRQAVGIA